MALNLQDHLGRLEAAIDKNFKNLPEIETVSSVDEKRIPREVNKWLQLEDAVAVFADIKGSTQLAYELSNQQAAAVIESGIKAMADTFYACDAKHAQIQGDGAYAVFYGDKAMENAMVAAITIQTFSERAFGQKVKAEFPNSPATGIKIGVASGPVIVKTLGKNRVDEFQDPSWVGIPVNFASKAAGAAGPGKMLVTASVWQRIRDNEYLTLSCVCNAEKQTTELWSPLKIDALADYSGEEDGFCLSSTWCPKCGPSFSQQILNGNKKRDLQEDERLARALKQEKSLNAVSAQKRASVRAYKKVM